MPPALVASVTAGPGFTGGTTAAIDTTGATLLIVSAGWWGGSAANLTYSDNKGNTWTEVTLQSGGSHDFRHQFAYCLSPIVGAGHTFTITGGGGYPVIVVFAFSGTSGYSYQTRSGFANDGLTSLPTGSVTPAFDQALVLTGIIFNTGSLPSSLALAPAGFAITTKEGVGGVNFPGAAAYLVQSPAAAVNPTWSWSGALEASASTAVFSGATTPAPARVSQAPVEYALLAEPAPARVSQSPVEYLTEAPIVDGRVTQIALELVYPFGCYTPFKPRPTPCPQSKLLP